MESSTLSITGHNHLAVPNTFFSQPADTRHLGMILPGYRHSVEKADLHYAGQILLHEGADLLRVEYAYNKSNFMEESEDERAQWLSDDVFAALLAARTRRSYSRVSMVGKSIGTLAMGHLLADPELRGANHIWLTPILTEDWLCSRVIDRKPRSLFVIGTADPYYRPDILERLVKETNGKALVIQGADHSLEIPGDVEGSLTGLTSIVMAMQAFLRPAP